MYKIPFMVDFLLVADSRRASLLAHDEGRSLGLDTCGYWVDAWDECIAFSLRLEMMFTSVCWSVHAFDFFYCRTDHSFLIRNPIAYYFKSRLDSSFPQSNNKIGVLSFVNTIRGKHMLHIIGMTFLIACSHRYFNANNFYELTGYTFKSGERRFKYQFLLFI